MAPQDRFGLRTEGRGAVMNRTGSRRSERFAELLDEGDGRRSRHRRTMGHTELAKLVSLARTVGTLDEAPDPDPGFQSSLRAMLMATIEREGIGTAADDRAARVLGRAEPVVGPEPAKQVRPAANRARVAAGVGVMFGALALSGVSAASTSAVPGDTLYQVKRSAEQAQLAFAGSAESKGRLYLDFANSRLLEARQVPVDRVDQALLDMDDDIVAGVHLLATAAVQGDPSAVGMIKAFVAGQRGRLTDLTAAVPGSSDAARRSFALLNEVDTRADGITAALRSGCPFVTPDRLGPKPATRC
jgi:hypothetical protein